MLLLFANDCGQFIYFYRTKTMNPSKRSVVGVAVMYNMYFTMQQTKSGQRNVCDSYGNTCIDIIYLLEQQNKHNDRHSTTAASARSTIFNLL